MKGISVTLDLLEFNAHIIALSYLFPLCGQYRPVALSICGSIFFAAILADMNVHHIGDAACENDKCNILFRSDRSRLIHVTGLCASPASFNA